jgi:predicted MFS family arabinose efflux permease
MAAMEVRGEMTTTVKQSGISGRQTWSAVGSMALCVALLIASEFMPVSLLTPIAKDLHATEGMTGQVISVSGLFPVITSLLIATIAGRYDRRHVLTALTAVMLISLMLIALAPNFVVLMAARALLGVVIGGFWSLATATVKGGCNVNKKNRNRAIQRDKFKAIRGCHGRAESGRRAVRFDRVCERVQVARALRRVGRGD